MLLLTLPVQAQIARQSRLHANHAPPRPSVSRDALAPLAQTPLLSNAASPDVIWVHCPPEAQSLGGACGTLPVPFDRRFPDRATINIYFEVYYANPGPAESAILFNAGGPGASITAVRSIVLGYFGQNLDLHDILLIDDRGRGGSAAIDCQELQHGTAPFAMAEADCVTQLDNAPQLANGASRFGTGDIAMDTDAVRAALGYDMVDYWGGSYGGEDVTAYATRFGQHLRSIVLDAPMGTPGLEAFELDGAEARSTVRAVRLACIRSPSCSPDHSDPDVEFDRLVNRLRNEPVRGKAHDAAGNLVAVTIDEAALLYLAIFGTQGNFVPNGELLAAADSLSKGDTSPLLRLGAEATPFVTDYGDATAYSQGDYFAALCVDAHEPWDWSVPMGERKHQFAEAVSELSSEHFTPFSIAAGTSLDVSSEKQCLWWQKPTPSEPVAPPNPTYPDVPTLVMVGDMDASVPLEEVSQVAARFPGSTLVPVAEAGHLTVTYTQCAATLQWQFFEYLAIGDTTCTKTPETVWPAVGRFPLVAADARPAEVDPAGTNEIGVAERKVVTVAVATAIDALKRSTIGGGNGAGLRAGNFESSVDANGNQTTTLTGCAFAKDVTVSGSLLWGADKSFVADLSVSGTGTSVGNLHVTGTWEAPGPVGNFRVSGTLGGAAVAVLVPQA
jgi:pimeloyl-ACP methyl ester carboxylesterase